MQSAAAVVSADYIDQVSDGVSAGHDGPGLFVRTVPIPDPGPLVDLMAEPRALAWIRNGDGMIGLGEVARHKPVGPADAEQWWHELCRTMTIEPATGSLTDSGLAPVPFGAGPVAFGSFVFDPDNTSAQSCLIVPRTVIGRRDGTAWRTDITPIGPMGDGPDAQPDAAHGAVQDAARDVGADRSPVTAPRGISYADGALTGPEWESAVAAAVRRIVRSADPEPDRPEERLHKVVLATDLIAEATGPIDPRWLVDRLAGEYRRCWTYHVDGLVGASPELLVRRENGLATSRVLAGTIRRGPEAGHDLALAAALSRSGKDLNEHEYAVASVARALAPFCSGMNVPDSPYVLELPNVLHLATDVTGVADRGAGVLSLVAALHPSAAVCGTPTELARTTIAELERMDRQRYAGPVGWVDAQGDGEWAIALRCGQLDPLEPNRIRLFAGCGIVAGSEPEAELAEAAAKFVPMRDALG